LISEPIMPDLC